MSKTKLSPEQIEAQRNYFKDMFFEDSNRFGQHAVSSGQAANKSVFLANGGAILALLTFVGNQGAAVEKVAIFWAFVWFALGITAALAAQIAMYRSQARFASMSYRVGISIEWGGQPDDDAEVSKHDRAGKRWIGINLAMGGASVISFLIGSFVALDAIT